MQRNPDKWIYTVECANPEGNEDLSKDYRFNKNGWRWSKGYDTVEAICNKYTRGEAVDMVFNKHYTFVKYLATQHLPWGDNTVSFIKETALERVVMNLDEIWDKLPEAPENECAVCYGSCAQCVYRKVDLETNKYGNLLVKDIHCLYDKENELMQSLAKGNHYCTHFTCLHKLSKNNNSKC